MAVKKLKPTSAGQRHKVINTYKGLTRRNTEKSLVRPMGKTGGRNNQGRMTIRYRGGGHKQRYRFIDFAREKHGIPATVKQIEYDPNRTAWIALVVYADGEKRYILAPEGLTEGRKIMSGEKAGIEVGNALRLKELPLGTVVHNIEMRPGGGGKIGRSAGSYAQLNAREGKYAVLKMPSGETRYILNQCRATIGTVSNGEHSLVVSGKAGRSRWKGRRPRVRGVAMNPVDHPMGGGEGRASGGLPRNRNGVMAKGLKTRKPKNKSNRLIIERKKRKRK